jgi:hypothetical protein
MVFAGPLQHALNKLERAAASGDPVTLDPQEAEALLWHIDRLTALWDDPGWAQLLDANEETIRRLQEWIAANQHLLEPRHTVERRAARLAANHRR